jgi:hypothetical protein
MDVICQFANLRLLGNRVLVGLIGMNLHNAWLWQMNWLWCKLMFLLLDLLHFVDKPLECIHNQDTILWTMNMCLWIFYPWFVVFAWCDCHHYILKWMIYHFFYQIKYLGAIDENDSFGYIMQALYISWNCNNDYNGVPFIYLCKGMFCQDWHLALG